MRSMSRERPHGIVIELDQHGNMQNFPYLSISKETSVCSSVKGMVVQTVLAVLAIILSPFTPLCITYAYPPNIVDRLSVGLQSFPHTLIQGIQSAEQYNVSRFVCGTYVSTGKITSNNSGNQP